MTLNMQILKNCYNIFVRILLILAYYFLKFTLRKSKEKKVRIFAHKGRENKMKKIILGIITAMMMTACCEKQPQETASAIDSAKVVSCNVNFLTEETYLYTLFTENFYSL